MVKLNKYRAQQGLATPATPDVRVSSYKAQALEQFGSTLTSVASHFGSQLADRQTRRQKMEADAAFTKWKGGVGTAFDDATFNMQPGANGFAGGFMSGTFDKSSADFLAQLEQITDDPEILAFYRNKVAEERTRVGGRATEAERKEMVRFQTDHIGTVAEEQIGLLVTDPDSYETVTTGLHGLIDASNLPAIERAELHKQVDMAAAEGLLAAYADDPLKQFELLGGDWDKLSPDAQGKLMTEALGEVPAPLASALEQLSGARSGFDTTKPPPSGGGWISNVDTANLSLYGGGGIAKGQNPRAHSSDPTYGDYSMAFRVVSFDREAAGGANAIKVGERNGRAVWADPDYYKDEKGNYVTHVSPDEAVKLAEKTGSLFMTKAELDALTAVTKGFDFTYQKGPDGGPATNQPGRGDSLKSSNDFKAALGDYDPAQGVHGFKELYIGVGPAPEATQKPGGGGIPQAGGVAYGIVRVGEYNMNLADAIRIGQKIDPGAPKSMNPKTWSEYLTDPVLSQAYAQAFFAEALEANGGDRAAAYVQFFLGDERAAEWNEGGRKAGDLPRGVSEAMGGITGAAPRGVMNPPSLKPENVQIKWTDKGGTLYGGSLEAELQHLSPWLVDAVKASMAAIGRSEFGINDAFREWGESYGSRTSDHKVFDEHGNRRSDGAMDIDVSGWSVEERLALLEHLSANGVQSFGVTDNGNGYEVIHAGAGRGIRAWGYGNKAKNQPEEAKRIYWPGWADEFLANHEAGLYASGQIAPRGTPGSAGQVWSGTKQVVATMFEQAGYDPIMGLVFADIESGLNPSVQGGGKYWGLFQNDKDAMAAAGLDWSSAEDSTAYALKNMSGTTVPYFKGQVGRAPEGVEFYLLHQQGLAGGTGLIRYPDQPAWRAVQLQVEAEGGIISEAKARQHINGNVPSQFTGKVTADSPASDFVAMWDGIYRQKYAKFSGGSWSDQAQGRGYAGVGDPRLGALPAKRRAAALEEALTAINGKAPTLTDQRAMSKSSLDDEIARMEQTGSFSEGFNFDAALAPLTVGDQNKYMDKANLAAWQYELDQKVPQMSAEQMDMALEELDNPKRGVLTALQQDMDAALIDAIEAVQKAREADPVKESVNDPDTLGAWTELGTAMEGLDIGMSLLDAVNDPAIAEKLATITGSVTAFIDRTIAVQTQTFGLNPTQTQHLPKMMLRQIARDMNTILTLPDRTAAEKRNDIALFVATAQQLFGEYTDEVLIEAMEVMDNAPETIPNSPHKTLYDRVKAGRDRAVQGYAEAVNTSIERPSQRAAAARPDDDIPTIPVADSDDLPTARTPEAQEIMEDTDKLSSYLANVAGWLSNGMTEDEAREQMAKYGFNPDDIDAMMQRLNGIVK